MAKLHMLKVSVCGLRSDRKTILERMQRLGVVEIEPLRSGEGTFTVDTTQQRDSIKSGINALESAIAILDEYAPQKGVMFQSFRGRPEITEERYAQILERWDRNLARCFRIASNKRQIEDLRADNVRLNLRIDSLKPWLDLDVSMRVKGTRETRAFIGTLPNSMSREEILTMLAQRLPEFELYDVEVVSNQSNMTCVMVVSHISGAAEVEEVLRSLGFATPSELSKKPPQESVDELQERIRKNDDKIEQLIDDIVHYAPRRELFVSLLDYCTMRLEKYENIERLAHTRSAFILEGWVPEVSFEKLSSAMEECGAYIEKIEPGKKEQVPVALKNDAFTEGGEPIVELYSMPSKNDIDPTPVMAIFYYLLFGIMLADAAYGLILVLVCGFVLLKWKPEGSQKRNMKLFMFSGASAVVWGLLFGSFFGNLPNVIATTFFGATENVFNPIWFDPIVNPMQMMVFSIGIGIVHVVMGLVMGIVTAVRNRDYMSAFADSFSWIMVIAGLLMFGIETLLGIFSMGDLLTVPEPVKQAGVIIMVFGLLVILIFAGRSSKSIGKRVLKGAYALYNATGYLSDFLSYSRLLALGLATGVISQVFNTIGTMFGGGIFGAVMLVIVGLIGHALNIGISLIGCYVHTCRLQYVEFFGKFYEGGGREFRPFSAKTKSFKFKEEK